MSFHYLLSDPELLPYLYTFTKWNILTDNDKVAASVWDEWEKANEEMIDFAASKHEDVDHDQLVDDLVDASGDLRAQHGDAFFRDYTPGK